MGLALLVNGRKTKEGACDGGVSSLASIGFGPNLAVFLGDAGGGKLAACADG